MTDDKVPLAIREKARDLHYAITDAIRLHHLTPPAHNELRRLLTEALATDYEAASARAEAAEALLRQVIDAHTGENIDGCGMTNAQLSAIAAQQALAIDGLRQTRDDIAGD
ncbi:hypothetical protein IP90_00994 [Luteimonas cucumeris]|uniref:Uncharacterized protein n=1 Tax=Luteimonas cucumeris TaxID=985012 RepID=A0A562LBM1_9GAMM|nr:hypothetical protein [Luteimonas cucumeris]TWI04854.1 hypothetical protein IP90_00994 [Luteimonas cucumeris]